ncbi:hypothetical protein MUK42_18249 [Musa troglodytarum]|uniref:Uncharacterized protein n=1 Tax=Musa troglodytarum TaxID=320322 RepID=A0A9E7FXA5_9LILI|nr:hypothetical protein MUK42_34369 [Musa troglodytarum]URE04075.1 hypothetical protein MUK42_18249 [Musa troglodytarum]
MQAGSATTVRRLLRILSGSEGVPVPAGNCCRVKPHAKTKAFSHAVQKMSGFGDKEFLFRLFDRCLPKWSRMDLTSAQKHEIPCYPVFSWQSPKHSASGVRGLVKAPRACVSDGFHDVFFFRALKLIQQ